MSRLERMKTVLSQGLAPLALELADDSMAHAGHAGARPGGETHYRLAITSAAFAGLSRVDRQRLVNRLLAPEFDGGLHALQMTCLAPGEK